MTEICEEHVRIEGLYGPPLAGVLSYPLNEKPCARILLCSPHPNFAGNMENSVIVALARGLSKSAVTLRFDYRGVGASGIQLTDGESVYDFWNRVEETQEYAAPLQDTENAFNYLNACAYDLPMYIVGYSFGCITGLIQLNSTDRIAMGVGIAAPLSHYAFNFLPTLSKPCLMLSGSDDFVFNPEAWTRLKQSSLHHIQYELIGGHDHFFRGDEDQLCLRVMQYFNLASAHEGEQP
jgi:uncharacterized protein